MSEIMGFSKMEIDFDGFENSFFDLDAEGISYYYWQCHEDLSVHLFIGKYCGNMDVVSFYLSAWKMYLKEYNFNDGSTEEEIESVFREDIKDKGRILYSKISVSDLTGSELKNLPQSIQKNFFGSFDVKSNKLEVFKEDADPVGLVDYIFVDEYRIGLLMFI